MTAESDRSVGGDGEHRDLTHIDEILELIDEGLAPTAAAEDHVPPLPVRRGATCWRCRRVPESGPSGLCATCRRAVGRDKSARPTA